MNDITPDTKVTRQPQMAVEDPVAIKAILKAAPFCNVAFTENSFPVIIPMAHASDETHLFLHGYHEGRFFKALSAGAPLCVSVTLFDGLVLAKSAYSHAMNYRSVSVYGSATEISDVREKLAVLKMISDKYVPGRWETCRHPNKQEMAEVMILKMPLDKISGKSRKGTPGDMEQDLDYPVWSGAVPFELVPKAPVTDPKSKVDIPIPQNVLDVVKKGAL